MKDETCDVTIKDFEALKSKNYKNQTFITEGNHGSKKAIGIIKNVLADKLKYLDYKNVLLNRSYMRHEMNRILSRGHNIGLCSVNKISLPSYSNKNYIRTC